MDFLNQIYYPEKTKNIIKYQYKTKKGDLYIVTESKTWIILYQNDKKIKESQNYSDIIKLIPEGK
jgi:hypothetical protein